MVRHCRTDVLDIAYEEHGPADGVTAVLLHGFPYDVRAYDDATALLARAGLRVVVPWLRGYGPTRYRSPTTLRSGQQAALAHDLKDLLDALGISRAILGGYDWGGRAACIVAALWPERCAGLVSCTGYNIQDIPGSARPGAPEQEHRHWYQYYFHGERGRAGLHENRRALCHLLWRLWSPNWTFDMPTFESSARSFDNPDFVETVIHSYRHRFGLVSGDPAYAATEARLAGKPPITVPTVVLHGGGDGVSPPENSEADAVHFTGGYARRIVPTVGHNLPQEAPAAFADAVRGLA